MPSRGREVVLGAVVFMAAVIAVGGSVWLSERYAGAAGGYKLIATFDSVQGLDPGSWVTLRGVKVGKVLRIDIHDGRPAATLGFEKISDLPQDSKLVLRSRGMLGEKEIEVHLGSDSLTLVDGATVAGSTSPSMDDLTASVADVVRDLNGIVSRARSGGSLAHVRGILARLDETSVSLRDVVAENRGSISSTFDSLARATADARGMVGENRAGVKQAVENLNLTTQRLSNAAENLSRAGESLRELLDHLNVVSRQIREGEGTVGRLVYDQRLYDDLQRTVTSVDSLVSDMEKRPDRYFKFSVF